MAMGIEQQYGLKLVIANKLYNSILFSRGIHTGIDDGALFGIIIKDIGIFLVGVIYKGADLGHGYLFECGVRKANCGM